MSVTISQYAERYYSEANLILLIFVSILHQLIGSLSPLFTRFIHSRWCRISSINSILVVRARPDNWQVLWKRPHPWPSQDLISWHLGRSGNDLSWHKMYIKTCCDMMEQTWTNSKPNKFIFLYTVYKFISSCRNSYPSSTGFLPMIVSLS